MKLSQNILFKRVNDVFTFMYKHKDIAEVEVGRPVFFSNTTDCDDRAVIINAAQFAHLEASGCALRNTLLFCTEPLTTPQGFSCCSVLCPYEPINGESLLNALQDIYDLFESWKEELTRICSETGDYQDMVNSTVSVLYDPLCVVDRDLKHVAYCQKSIDQGLVDTYVTHDNRITAEMFGAIITDAEFAEFYSEQEPFVCTIGGVETVSLNISFREEFRGRVIVHCSTQESDTVNYYKALLSLLSPFADRLYARIKTLTQDYGFYSTMRSLVSDALEGKHIARTSWSSVLIESSWEIGDALVLVQLRPDQRYDKNIYWKYVSEDLEMRWSGCIAFEHQDVLLLLVNLSRFKSPQGTNFGQALSYFLRDNLLTAGISREIRRFRDIPQAYTQTVVALRFGTECMPTHWYHQFDNYTLEYLLSLCTTELTSEQVSSTELLELKRHDALRGTEYFKTLATYFDCSFNALAASKQLCIHRSTFIARMNRIQELVSLDLSSPKEVLYLQLSLRLLSEDSPGA